MPDRFHTGSEGKDGFMVERERIRDPLVSVIIPVYNAADTIEHVLDGLVNQDYPSDKFEVLVVDDGSTDGGERIIGHYPVRLLKQNHKGASAARNKGIRNARGEFILLLDSDCFVDADWIRLHVDAQNKYGGQACVGGSFAFPPKGVNFIERCDYYSCWYEQHPLCPSRFDYEYLPSTNMSFSRLLVDHVGGFDESLQTGEDVDFCQRIVQERKRIIFQPQIAVYHRGRTRLKDYLKHHYRWGKHAPTVRRYGSNRRFHFLFRPSLVWALCMALPIAVGYTCYIVGRGFRFFAFRILLFSPMILFAKIAYAAGVVKGTLELQTKNV